MTYYDDLGTNRKYRLESYLSLLIQKLFSIPTIDTLIIILKLSSELRLFCVFFNGVTYKSSFKEIPIIINIGGDIMFNIEDVKKDLNNFKKVNKESFFTRKRLLAVFIKTLKNTKLWLLLFFLTILLYFRPVSKEPKSYDIYFNQFIALILLSIFVFSILVVLYENLTNEYFIHFKESFVAFNRLMKIVITFFLVIMIVLILNVQIFFINHWLNPNLETCSFYDWYGNKIYNNDKPGTCPTLMNLETENNIKITFGVINESNSLHEYVEYEYIYENEKLLKREIVSYRLTEEEVKIIDDIDIKSKPILDIDIIENSYLEGEFSSRQKYESFNEDGTTLINEEKIIRSKLNEDDEIVVSRESINNQNSETTELFRLKKIDDNKNKLILHDLYSFQKWPNENIKETYFNMFKHESSLELKSIEYSNNIWVTYHKTAIIKNMVVNDTFHRFAINYNSVRTKISSIDHYIDNNLLYKNIFIYTDYGYQVKHYSYYRNMYGRIVDIDVRPDTSYCYASKDLINNNDFDYENISNDRVSTYCTAPLFYIDNPLFLIN